MFDQVKKGVGLGAVLVLAGQIASTMWPQYFAPFCGVS